MNYRCFVEKKKHFNIEARHLHSDLCTHLGVRALQNLRLLNVYDIFGVTPKQVERMEKMVFSEIPTDHVYHCLEDVLAQEKTPLPAHYFCVESLAGQYDARADAAAHCAQLIAEKDAQEIHIQTAQLIILYGEITQAEITQIKHYYINALETREKDLTELAFREQLPNRAPCPVYENFNHLDAPERDDFLKTLALSMSPADLICVQDYFRDVEKRAPTEAEIKMLDTYWSDHCRHTTFETILGDIEIVESPYENKLSEAFSIYEQLRTFVYGDGVSQKPMTLMDMATICAKAQRKRGHLQDVEISDEINACSLYIDVPVNHTVEKWILQFKNETHNHPTEIEPFGGASTCLGGAIRDPLSGRAYVYQALRISGSANPKEAIADTLAGKLPQRTITQKAAHGFSSYGNQIGLATTFVRELYDEGYKAKRMEVGMVVGASPATHIRREKPVAGDVILLVGGRTGRDGIGGATGSSKVHTQESAEKCGAEVQKGNPITERKLQRLLRRAEVAHLIKKCNDFGAGGVSVAVGELAEGVDINLSKIPTKYVGLTATELALSESQERLAVVIAREDYDTFMRYADEENVEATLIAQVNGDRRVRMFCEGKMVVDMARDFLDTNGARAHAKVAIARAERVRFSRDIAGANLGEKWENNLRDLNVCSQQGLVEMFDSTIGATTVLMPFGGKFQLTPAEVSVQKIPVLHGETHACSVVSYGYQMALAKCSPFHGAFYGLVESLCKMVATGGNYQSVRFTLQEYFERLGTDAHRWAKPFTALLGALYVQEKMGLPAIGGKDSMSGTYQDLHVPPTLISFAVSVGDAREIISNEFKKSGHYIYYIKAERDADDLLNLDILRSDFDFLLREIRSKKIVSASAVGYGGVAETLSKMCFGNLLGAEISYPLSEEDLFAMGYGSFVMETSEKLDYERAQLIGEVRADGAITLLGERMDLLTLLKAWRAPLSDIFPSAIDRIGGRSEDLYHVLARERQNENGVLNGKNNFDKLENESKNNAALNEENNSDKLQNENTNTALNEENNFNELENESKDNTTLNEENNFDKLENESKNNAALNEENNFNELENESKDNTTLNEENNFNKLENESKNNTALNEENNFNKLENESKNNVALSEENNFNKLQNENHFNIENQNASAQKIISTSGAQPRVYIPVFPGTNCEYDLQRAFEHAGAKTKIGVFRNLSPADIRVSVNEMAGHIARAQILMFSGGFSAGDEPDGSAKFIVAVLHNKKIAQAVAEFLTRGGLILGICNGFQALIKSGLLPYGEVRTLRENSPTLTYNINGRHISRMATTRIITTTSPWLSRVQIGDTHTLATSHGEGRLMINEAQYKQLLQKNQIASVYTSPSGYASDEGWSNPNGSQYNVEGMLACEGRIFGKMLHAERIDTDLYKNIYGEKVQGIFESGVDYFR